MNIELKIILSLLLLAALSAIGFGIKSWDDGRIDAAYERGVQAERAAWVAAQAEANAKQQADEDADTAASEQTADNTRAAADTAKQATTAATTKREARIQNEYQSNPQSADSCTSDGRPADLPVGVRKELDQARRAAESASTTPRRLRTAAGGSVDQAEPDHHRPDSVDAVGELHLRADHQRTPGPGARTAMRAGLEEEGSHPVS